MTRDSKNSKEHNWWGRHSHIDKSFENHVIKSKPHPRINGILFKLYSRSMVKIGFYFLKVMVSVGVEKIRGGAGVEDGRQVRSLFH